MKLKAIAITAPLATALFCGIGEAQQQTPSSSTPDATTKSAKNDSSKEKHWSGSLVDVGCMAKALASGNASTPQVEPGAGAPHFAGEAGDPQIGQVPGGGAPGGIGAGQRVPEPGTPNTTPTNDAGGDQRAQADQANRVDNAAKACAASSTTQNFGLAMANGQIVKFDADGQAKAQEAMKEADVQPGKKVKAKVSGFMEDKNTVKVASVDVKGKGKGKGK